MTNIKNVKKFYDDDCKYEENRLFTNPIHEAEYLLTIDVFEKYIRKNSKILDLGCGPGIYSEYLIKNLNCNLSLIDLSEKELALFQNRVDKKTKEKVDLIKVCSATDLDWLPNKSFDYILLQGPLYHLTKKSERKIVLRHVSRILKKNGIVFCAFISPHHLYAEIFDKGINNILDGEYLNKIKKGTFFHTNKKLSIEQYRCWPSEAIELLKSEKFKIIHSRNLEGVFSYLDPSDFKHLNNKKIKNNWLKILKETCENPDLIGSTLHYLIAGKKISNF